MGKKTVWAAEDPSESLRPENPLSLLRQRHRLDPSRAEHTIGGCSTLSRSPSPPRSWGLAGRRGARVPQPSCGHCSLRGGKGALG